MDYELAALLAQLPPDERERFVKAEQALRERLSEEAWQRLQDARRAIRREVSEALFEGRNR